MGDRENEQFRKLFIGGLSYDTTEDSLKNHFGQWGNIIDCVVMKDATTKRSRGFGFITYATPEELNEAQKNRPHRLDGRQVESKRAMPRNKDGGEGESSQSCKKMFVGGLSEDATEDQVRGTFGSFGDIEKVDLIKDKNTGKNKRFCFVTFFDYDPVDQCVLKKRHDVNGKIVEVKKAVPKDQEGGMGGRGGGRGGMGGRGGSRGGMGGGRGGSRGDWDQGGGGGGFNQQGGFNDYSQGGGYNQGSGGGDYNQNWNQGGGGGYDNYNSGYNNQSQNSSGNWGGNQQQSFGQNYGDSYGGGAMRGGGGGGGGYNQQRSTPYNQSQGNYNRGGGGGGYNRR